MIDPTVLGTPREVDLDGAVIRYRECGSGEPLVFVHGFAVNGLLWRKVVPKLSGQFRCIVPDWPFGSHELPMPAKADMHPPALAKRIADFLSALKLDTATLIGNDLGGALCQLVVERYPERVARLILNPCDAFGNFPPPRVRYLVRLATILGMPFVITQTLRLKPLRRLPITYGVLTKRRLGSEILDAYMEPMTCDRRIRRDAAKVIAGLSPHYTEAALAGLARFPRPVLLAWARDDYFFPFAHAEKLQEVFPKAEIIPIEDAHTLIAEDQPERLWRAISKFCNKWPLATG